MEVSGGEETARQIYREAITAFPTDKRPWLGLAQSYFELSDFGNAILAAQEVVQRDPEDETAHGILAISGLRVATMALGSIRESGDINASARREAEIMSRNLRILFGSPEKAAEKETPAARRATAPVRSRPAPAQAARPAPAPRAERPAPAPRPAPAAPSNPFGALR
jgi:tetratricopeptide (TPR) repeat protein